MTTTTTEREQALSHLRRIFPRGATVYGIFRHWSRTRKSMEISVVAFAGAKTHHPTEEVATACDLVLSRRSGHDAIAGSGEEPLKQIAQSLAQALYGDPTALAWEWL